MTLVKRQWRRSVAHLRVWLHCINPVNMLAGHCGYTGWTYKGEKVIGVIKGRLKDGKIVRVYLDETKK